MKVQIRKGVFETNSSSVHTMTVSKKDFYDRIEDSQVYLKMCMLNEYEFLNRDEAIEWNIEKLRSGLVWVDEALFVEYRETGNMKEAYGNLYGYNSFLEKFADVVKWDPYNFYFNIDECEFYMCDHDYHLYAQTYRPDEGDALVMWGYFGVNY